MAKNVIDWIAMILVIIGAINWGLIGLFNLNLVAEIFGTVTDIIYILVGLSGLWMIYLATQMNK